MGDNYPTFIFKILQLSSIIFPQISRLYTFRIEFSGKRLI